MLRPGLSAQNATLDDVVETLFSPYRDPGLGVLEQPDWTWRAMPAARTRAHAVSAYPTQQAVLDNEIAPLNNAKPRHAVMYNVSPVYLDQGFLDEGIAIYGKVMNAFRKKGRLKHVFRNHLQDYFDAQIASYATKPATLPMAKVPSLDTAGADAVMRLSAPGMNNYFHGVWECLPLLIPAHKAGFKGEISLRSAVGAMPGFMRGFIDLVFPDLAAQITLDQIRPKTDGPDAGDYEDFYALMEWNTYAELAPESTLDIGMPIEDTPRDPYSLHDQFAYFFGISNSFGVLQKEFRDLAVAAIKDRGSSHLPKRFCISRKGSVRRPAMKGEEQLVAELIPLGFEEVQLETLSPADQVALFHNAEVVVGQHGAGMTNMMFCGPQTTVLEIGHGQTITRWRTFHQMAAAAGCQFEGFFCDYDTEDPTIKPNLARDGFPVPWITDAARAAIIDRVKALI